LKNTIEFKFFFHDFFHNFVRAIKEKVEIIKITER